MNIGPSFRDLDVWDYLRVAILVAAAMLFIVGAVLGEGSDFVLTDPKTGCQYTNDGRWLVQRVDVNGKHLGCKEDK